MEIYINQFRQELLKHNRLAELTELIKQRIRKNKDYVIAMTGPEGEGKSTLAIILGILCTEGFDLEKNIAYLPESETICKQFNSLPVYSTFIVDEAIKALLNYEYMAQTMLIKMYATERYQNKISLLCMPRFRNFSENFRNHRINMWIHIYERGTAVISLKDPDKDSDDPWHIKTNRKIKNRSYNRMPVADRDIKDIIYLEKKLPNYFMTINNISKLPKVIEDEYDRLKRESRKQQALLDDKQNGWKIKAERYLLFCRRLTFALEKIGIPSPDISVHCLGMHRRTVQEWLLNYKSGKDEKLPVIIKLIDAFVVNATIPNSNKVEVTKELNCNPLKEKENIAGTIIEQTKSKVKGPAPIHGIDTRQGIEEELN